MSQTMRVIIVGGDREPVAGRASRGHALESVIRGVHELQRGGQASSPSSRAKKPIFNRRGNASWSPPR